MNKFFTIILYIIISFDSFSQCTSTISNFPYNENFETSMGSWQSGGVGNDWAWGVPNKLYIISAGSGTKCWVTGGLNGSTYTNAERSYVESPCFDFTTLQYPHVKFNIYWESENQYDGGTFQYSINNGTTWTNVGAFGDAVNCLNDNWFNQNSINYLNTLATPKSGWAGTQLPSSGGCSGGNGSLGWKLAQHCMPYLAGVSNVKFRFAFGAGTSCNNFDGIAFDNITIGEASANNANFTFACTTNALEYQFTNTSILCPDVFSWNFGDPTSGTNNTSSLTNPTHQFSSPGNYNVTLTVSGPCNAPSTIIKSVVTISNTISKTDINCFGNSNGSISSTAINGFGGYTYTLLPNNSSNSTGIFNNLNSGNYTINVVDGNGCKISDTKSINMPNPIVISQTHQNNLCANTNIGSISASTTGGTGSGYSYLLNPGNITNSTGQFINLAGTIYTMTVSDGNNCSVTSTITITTPIPLSIPALTVTNILCSGFNTGAVLANVFGGTGTINYSLNGGIAINTSGNFNNLSAGNYTVLATDANSCTSSNTFSINPANPMFINNISIKNPGCSPNNDGEININASGGFGQLTYSIGGSFNSNNNFNSLTSNIYTVTVKDANGCTLTSTAELLSNNAPVFISTKNTDTKCFNSSDGTITVVANNGSVAISNYVLSPGGVTTNDGIFTNLSAGLYQITVKDINNCSNVTTVNVNSPQELLFDYTAYFIDSCGSDNNGKIVVTTKGGTGTITYNINPSIQQNVSGIFSNLSYGTYTITAKDVNNCNTNTTIEVKEKQCCSTVFVPSAFSPNNDGHNDELNLLNKAGITLDEFIIVNRWGNVVFNAQHIDDRWDGKYKSVDAEIGTYFYFLKYKCSSTKKDYFYKGDIILVR